MTKDEVSKILLIGGSSHIPKVQEIVQEFFDGKELCHDVDPDVGVAIGAAMMAGILANQSPVPGTF